jgi:Fe-S-cluster-containing hydrogenase component 2
MSEEVVLDQDECIGCETCVETCPLYYKIGMSYHGSSR